MTQVAQYRVPMTYEAIDMLGQARVYPYHTLCPTNQDAIDYATKIWERDGLHPMICGIKNCPISGGKEVIMQSHYAAPKTRMTVWIERIEGSMPFIYGEY